jgi:hypothetical protein
MTACCCYHQLSTNIRLPPCKATCPILKSLHRHLPCLTVRKINALLPNQIILKIIHYTTVAGADDYREERIRVSVTQTIPSHTTAQFRLLWCLHRFRQPTATAQCVRRVTLLWRMPGQRALPTGHTSPRVSRSWTRGGRPTSANAQHLSKQMAY